MIRTIEFVCQGNITRSKTAEAIAQRYLANTGFGEEYRVISTGVEVDRIRSGNYPIEQVQGWIKSFNSAGSRSPLFHKFNKAVQSGNAREIETYKNQVISFLIGEETRQRDIALRVFNLPRIPTPETIVQTVPNPEVYAVIPVTRKIKAEVERIYTSLAKKPIIETLDILATGNSDAKEVSLSEDPKQLWASYQNQINHVANQTPLAVNNLIARFS